MQNEIDYSLSGNVGITYREDVEPRSRFIELEYHEEHENARMFPNAYLHEWVADNRSLILSAIDALFQRWFDKGMPPGTTPFISFPKWASVIGGVMEVCGLGNPCLPRESTGLIGGDLKTAAMRALYSLVYDFHPDKWLTKQEVYQIIADNQETNEHLMWFGDFSSVTAKQKAKTKAGVTIATFAKRQLGEIVLQIDSSDSNSSRHKIRFVHI